MIGPAALDRQLEELARVLGDLLALRRDPRAAERSAALQVHAQELLSELMEQSCAVEAPIFARSLAGREDTDEKAATRRVALILYVYLAALNGLEEPGNRRATTGGRNRVRTVRAMEAYHRALEGFTREGAPQAWATTHNNIGAVLTLLGERENQSDRLEEAIEAYRTAVQERTREHAPLEWATTQNNLGAVPRRARFAERRDPATPNGEPLAERPHRDQRPAIQ